MDEEDEEALEDEAEEEEEGEGGLGLGPVTEDGIEEAEPLPDVMTIQGSLEGAERKPENGGGTHRLTYHAVGNHCG